MTILLPTAAPLPLSMGRIRSPAALMALVFLVSACGGGGGSEPVSPTPPPAPAPPAPPPPPSPPPPPPAPGPAPTVGSVELGTARYSQALAVTLNGTGLDQPLTLTSNACVNFTRITAPPRVSSATVAYYDCTVRAVGENRTLSVAAAGGAVLAQRVYDVPQPQVTLTVSNGAGAGGDFVITLLPTERPITVDNFLAYVASGFYVGTVFHRHAPNFVLQGGGFEGPMGPPAPVPQLKPTSAPIALETTPPVSNLRWTVAMARTQVLNSATSQFFVNLSDNVFLDTSAGGYAAFGFVSAGTETISAIVGAPCTAWPALLPAGDCIPMPNFTITAAQQTR
jgi:cyclophilin family peptidyl-prolyl cis-trans isomerase